MSQGYDFFVELERMARGSGIFKSARPDPRESDLIIKGAANCAQRLDQSLTRKQALDKAEAVIKGRK